MKSVFIDSSVLVAACASKNGASAYILGLCKTGRVKGYISQDVIGEAKKNVFLKLSEDKQPRLSVYLTEAKLKVVNDPLIELVTLCEDHIFPKDAPILAAALQSPCSYLITLDKKHFFTKSVVMLAKNLTILTPGDLIKKILRPKV